jgi:hypothetical protein
MNNVYVDENRKSCISYDESDGLVKAVRMAAPELELFEMGAGQFHARYVKIEQLASKAAATYLSGQIPFNPEVKLILENIMASKTPAAKKEVEGRRKTDEFFAGAEAKVAEAKAAKEPKVAKVKAEKVAKEPKAPRVPRVDITGLKITLLEKPEEARFNEGSIRSLCFAKIKDGMTVKSYLSAIAKAGICEEKQAIDNLKKLSSTAQKFPSITLE